VVGLVRSEEKAKRLLGDVLFAHGAQKVFGWFGGLGFDTMMTRSFQ
jgi:hypothetical protein